MRIKKSQRQRWGRKGARIALARMTPEARQIRARKAAAVRWQSFKAAAATRLAELVGEIRRGA
jgi:hypothetical protein